MKVHPRNYSILTQEELAARHFMSLFPNNHLDIVDLQQIEQLTSSIEEFYQIIVNLTSNERSILSWIREEEAYFIIASIMKGSYSFGHHDAFLFPEFQLGNSYQVDYLIVGKNSGGYEFIFVELEHPNKNITLKDGHIGDAIRKGERQVTDWKYWLESNYTALYETFKKYKSRDQDLPEEFMKFDSSRIHYVVVAGRRDDFNKKTYQLKLQKK